MLPCPYNLCSGCNASRLDPSPLPLQDLLCVSYHLRATGLFQQLAESGRLRVASAGDLSGNPAAPSMAALIDLLEALQAHQQSTDAAQALPALAETVSQNAAAVLKVLPDIAADAVVALWEGSKSLLEGSVGGQDAGAERALKV